jgi:hypothetical protein
MILQIAILVGIIILIAQGIKNTMTNAELLALLQSADAEVHDIAGKVQTLLNTIANGANVPQDVVDAANTLKTDLDALNTQAGG